MSKVNPPKFELRSHKLKFRVRYRETDAQGHVHHSNYLNYFEIARVEMLRAGGINYRWLEEQGIYLVVSEVGCQYFSPANYDDLLEIQTKVTKAKGVRIRHQYEIRRDDQLLVTGFTVVAAVNPQGRVIRLPKWLRMD